MRAWRARDSYAGVTACARGCTRSPPTSAWTSCARNKRRVPVLNTIAEVPWLQPYPDQLLDEVAPTEDPARRRRRRLRAIALTYMARDPTPAGAPARGARPARRAGVAGDRDGGNARAERAGGQQRAAARTGDAQGAAASARRRPRRAERGRAAAAAGLHRHPRERRLSVAADLMREDIRVSMPPHPECSRAWSRCVRCSGERARWASGGSCRRARTGCPAAASYLRRPGDTVFRAFKLDVLRCEEGGIAEITTFGPALFGAFGLPDELADGARVLS